jgi:hypothetical protein
MIIEYMGTEELQVITTDREIQIKRMLQSQGYTCIIKMKQILCYVGC